MFHVTFVLILYFDWLQGPNKGQNLEKHSKIFFSEIVKGLSLYFVYMFLTVAST